MKKGQKNFIFERFASKVYNENYTPLGHFTTKDEFVDYWNRRGYLCKNIINKKVMYVSAYLAKANIPLKERIKLQEDINNSPIDESVQSAYSKSK